MGKAYSADLRARIVNHIASGQSRRSASRHFGVSPSCAVKLARRVAATGSAQPARQGRPPEDGKLAPHMVTLTKWIDGEPDITMPELSARLGRYGRSGASGLVVASASESWLQLQKKRCWHRNADAMMLPRRAVLGVFIGNPACAGSLIILSSLMKRRPRPR